MRRLLMDMRFVPALVLGLIVAFGLFLLMHNLIANSQQPKINADQISLVNFVTVHKDEQVQTRNFNRPKPPPPPKKPPPTEQVQTQSKNVSQRAQQLPVNIKFDQSSIGGGGVYIGPASDSNRGSYAPLTPMVRIAPIYPPQAQVQNVTGVVKTCFTVNPDGSVSSPHVVHASSPQARRLLGQAALQTIMQWKFFPQKVQGKPVATKGVCQDIKFQLNGNGG